MLSVHGFLVDLARLLLWLVILSVIFVPLERFFALRPRKILRPGLWIDLGLYFLNSFVPTLLIALPMAAVATLARQLLPGWWVQSIAALPLWLAMLITFVVGEIGFYWGHRWSHEWRWMWHFHRVHHAPDGLDWLVSPRAHPVDMIFTRLCGLVPLYLLGLAQTDTRGSMGAVMVVLIGTTWGFFIHANIRCHLGPLEHVIASPRFHHWHHVRSGPINRNYSPMLPIFDRLFGTLYLPKQGWPEAYGIDETPSPRESAPESAVSAKS